MDSNQQDNGALEFELISNVIVGVDSPAQAEKVLKAVKPMWHSWQDEESRTKIRAWLLVPETFPHLAKMADLEPASEEWKSELGAVIRKAWDGIGEVEEAAERVIQVLSKLTEQED